jgi:hypothetical protein
MTVLFSIRKGDNFGFIDASGKVVIAPRFQNDQFLQHHEGAVDFSDWVPIKQNKRWGFIDAAGRLTLEPQFLALLPFSENLAAFSSEELGRSYGIGTYKWGYIDRKGKVVIEPRYGSAGEFDKGVAIVNLPDADGNFSEYAAENALINRRGAIVCRGYDSIYPGVAGLFVAERNGKWGYLNKLGKVAIPFKFDDASPFREGRACVTKGNKRGVIDSKGALLFRCRASAEQPSYGPAYRDHLSSFAQGMLLDVVKGKCGFLNRDGKVVVDYLYDDATAFSEGLAAVKIGKKWGYINKRGKVTIEPQFEEPSEFREGLAHAKVKLKVGEKTVARFGFIDSKGGMVIAPQFTKTDERAVCFEHGLAAVVCNKQRCYIDKQGAVVWRE